MGYLVHRTRSFTAGLLYLVGSFLLSGVLMLTIGVGRRLIVSKQKPACGSEHPPEQVSETL
jgi:hypothetical protein